MIRKLLRRPALAALRYRLWTRDAHRDARVAKTFAAHQGKQVIDIYRSPILDSAASKTLFILGSGWSVNELTDRMLRHIGDHQSVGINFWFFHNFVPTAFSFDAGKVPEGEEDEMLVTVSNLGRLFGRQEIRDAKPRVLYLRPYQSNPGYLVPGPPELSELSWVTGRANLLSGDPGSVEADLRYFVRLAMSGRLPQAVLPDNGASVARLVFLALAQGFRDIVLVGIDLDIRPHFWFAPHYVELYPEYVALFPDPDDQPHGTTESADRTLGNLQFLELMGKVLTELGVAKLWIASPTSKLANGLPQYPWPTTANRH
jgi:hypothetical protein